MTLSPLLFVAIVVVAMVIAYSLGHVDGYWRRASEDRARRLDDVLHALELEPERYRTEGGEINRGKLRATLQHPEEYLPPGHWLLPSHT